jgi:hypothetical protein
MTKYFTEAARVAAAIARRKQADQKAQNSGRSEVFVVRAGNCYTWEVRKFGALVVLGSNQHFASAELARDAGISALSAMSDPIRSARSLVYER